MTASGIYAKFHKKEARAFQSYIFEALFYFLMQVNAFKKCSVYGCDEYQKQQKTWGSGCPKEEK